MEKIILIAFSLLLLTLIGCDKEKKQTKQPTWESIVAEHRKQNDAKEIAAKKALKSNFKSKEQIDFEKNYLKEYQIWQSREESTREGEKKYNDFLQFNLSLYGTEIKNWKCRYLGRIDTWQSIDYPLTVTRETDFLNRFSQTCVQPNMLKIDGEWVKADDGHNFSLLNNTNESFKLYRGDKIEFSGILIKADEGRAFVVVKFLKVIPVN